MLWSVTYTQMSQKALPMFKSSQSAHQYRLTGKKWGTSAEVSLVTDSECWNHCHMLSSEDSLAASLVPGFDRNNVQMSSSADPLAGSLGWGSGWIKCRMSSSEDGLATSLVPCFDWNNGRMSSLADSLLQGLYCDRHMLSSGDCWVSSLVPGSDLKHRQVSSSEDCLAGSLALSSG